MRLMLGEEDTPRSRALSAELFRIDRYAEMALNYARLNSTSNDLVFAKVEVEPVIKRVVRQYAGQFVRKHIALKCDIAPVQVLTDEKWLAFILGQMLANAVKYTESGTVTVTVTKNKVLKVSDTGIGIAPEDLPRIFEKGFTGYNGRAEKKSTGLGMYLSRRYARPHAFRAVRPRRRQHLFARYEGKQFTGGVTLQKCKLRLSFCKVNRCSASAFCCILLSTN